MPGLLPAASQVAEAKGPARPKIRLLHHMARSGGTLISKCLGCMSGVLLLSEINPRGTRWFNPLVQAQAWFRLFSDEEFGALEQRPRIGFTDAIGWVQERAEVRHRQLVLRDWSHLDFTGVPFVRNPAYRLMLADVLRPRFDLVQACTVRHPIDQWQSLARLQVMRGHLFLEPFLAGYRRFAEAASELGYIRYEDVTAAPGLAIADLCNRLELAFDPGFLERWSSHMQITGDVGGSRGGNEIKPVTRRPVSPELLATLERNADYRCALDLLGYEHPL